MGRHKLNLRNKKFGRLVVLGEKGKDNSGNILWESKCNCGNKHIATASSIKNGGVQSCGCKKKERFKKFATTHGYSGTRINSIWKNLKHRCKSNGKDAKYYINKGIKVCKRWEKFENFLEDMGESYNEHVLSHGEKETEIDRINNNKGYNKKNCRWVTQKEQSLNRSCVKNI